MLNAIVLSGTQVSDLFFNHENVNLAHALSVGNDSTKQIEEAVRKDAKSFSEFIGGQISAEDLAKDFISRL